MTGTRWVAAGCVVTFLIYVALRLAAFSEGDGIGGNSDTPVYLEQASEPLSATAFWTGLRPPLVPLVYKALSGDPRSIVAFQFGFSLFCWGILASELARSLRRPLLRVGGFAAILAFGGSTPIIVWERVLLSESLSISLSAAMIAAALRSSREWTWRRGTLFMVITVLWGFTRQTNSWLLAVAAALLVPLAFTWSRQRRAVLLFAGVLLAVFLLNDWLPDLARRFRSAGPDAKASEEPDISQRWIYPLLNVFAQRVLTRPEAVEWFAARGMPQSPALRRQAGGWASTGFYEDPALREFLRWFALHGRSTYVRYLCSRPLATIEESLAAVYPIVVAPIATDAPPKDFVPLLTGPLAESTYPVRWALLSWTAAAMMATLVGAVAWRADRRWLVPAGLILLAYPHAAIIWAADAMDLGRHAVQMNVQLRLGMYLAMLFAVDTVLAARASGAAGVGETGRPEHSRL